MPTWRHWHEVREEYLAIRAAQRAAQRQKPGLPCPICLEPGGFHSPTIHSAYQVPRELLKPKGWLKEAMHA